MRWTVRLASALVMATVATSASSECPAPADSKAKGAAAAPLVLLERPGATSDAEIAVDRPTLAIPFLLRACAAEKAQVKLPEVTLRGSEGQVHKLRFVDEDGKAVGERPVAVTRGSPALLILRSVEGSLLTPGRHAGLVRAWNGAAGASAVLAAVPIRLEHTRSALPAAIASAPATGHQAPLPFFGAVRTVQLELLGRNDEEIGIHPVLQAVSLTRRRSDTAVTAEPLKLTAAPAQAVSTADGGTLYTLSFGGIGEAGRYDAVLRLAQDGYADKTASLTFYVRDAAWVAFLFILLGVLASYVMGRYGAVWRPRLVSQQHIGSVIDALRAAKEAAAGDADSLALVQRVMANVEAAWTDARNRRTPIDEATVSLYADIAQALQTWPAIVATLKAVRPDTIRIALLEKLQTAASAFSAAKPDAQAVKAAIATLGGMPDAARSKAAEALQAAVAELDTLLAGAVAPSLIAAQTQLVRAREFGIQRRFDDALAAYDAAVAAYAEHYRGLFEAEVDVAKPAPPGVRRDDWDAIATQTREALAASASARGDERLRALQAAVKAFLANCAASLRKHIAPLDAAEREPVEARLAELDKALAAGHLGEAHDRFAAAATLALKRSGGNAGSPMGEAAALGTSFDALTAFDLPAAWPSVSSPGAGERAADAMERYDLLVSILVILAAGFAGLETVWSKDPAWGGAIAYLGAFLFGLAVDQFAKTGVAALRSLKP